MQVKTLVFGCPIGFKDAEDCDSEVNQRLSEGWKLLTVLTVVMHQGKCTRMYYVLTKED